MKRKGPNAEALHLDVVALHEAAHAASFPKITLDKGMYVMHTLFMMKRTTVWMTPQQIAKLAGMSKRTGIKTAELIRRFIDEGLNKQK